MELCKAFWEIRSKSGVSSTFSERFPTWSIHHKNNSERKGEIPYNIISIRTHLIPNPFFARWIPVVYNRDTTKQDVDGSTTEEKSKKKTWFLVDQQSQRLAFHTVRSGSNKKPALSHRGLCFHWCYDPPFANHDLEPCPFTSGLPRTLQRTWLCYYSLVVVCYSDLFSFSSLFRFALFSAVKDGGYASSCSRQEEWGG